MTFAPRLDVLSAAQLALYQGTAPARRGQGYLDIAALLDHGVPLSEIVGAARALFGPVFSPLVAQKSLCYFEGGDLSRLDETVRAKLVAAAAQEITPASLMLRSPRLDA